MALTFPIDQKEPSEIPAFAEILGKHPGTDRMIKYLCYRFDPKCEAVRNSSGSEAKQRIAQDLSGFICPIPEVAFIDENSEVHFSDEWTAFSQVTSLFFPLLNNPKWEFLTSLELLIDEGNSIMREPIPEVADIDIKAKSQSLKITTAKGGMEMLKMRDEIMSTIADKDDVISAMLDVGTSSRKNLGRSKRDPITGKVTST